MAWHRKGFRLFWTWISRRKSGRPETSPAIQALILKMAAANPLWGAPRIHGELLKLGIPISERTVSRLLPRKRRPPSQTWKAFLDNHLNQLVSIDFFTVPTASPAKGGSLLLSVAVQELEGLAPSAGHRQARDRRGLAS